MTSLISQADAHPEHQFRMRTWQYPSWSTGNFDPFSTTPQQGVRHDDELAHDGGQSDLLLLSRGDELRVLCLKIGIEAGGDEGRHVQRPPH
jgi:hypothetical protein